MDAFDLGGFFEGFLAMFENFFTFFQEFFASLFGGGLLGG